MDDPVPEINHGTPTKGLRNLGLTIAALTALSTTSLAADEAQTNAPSRLELSVGQVGIAESLDDPLRVGIQYSFRPVTAWKLSPGLGFIWSENGARYVYTNVQRDFMLTDRLALTPSFGVGLFDDSDDLRLGHELEFRSGLSLAYQFANEYRLGAGVFHFSNGGLGDRNPGTESALVFLSVPL